MELIMLSNKIRGVASKIYMGVDCSSKAIHSVWIDSQESILTQHKWGSKEKDFDTRFLDFGEDFWVDLSKIKVILNNDTSIYATVEAPIYIQNPKATISIASVDDTSSPTARKIPLYSRPVPLTSFKVF